MNEKLLATVLGRLFIVACVLWAALGSPALGASPEPIATVIAASGPVEVVRAGSRVPLTLKDPVFVSDSILTGEGGKIQILFSDGSTVNIAPGSAFDMASYADAGSESNFAANLFQGAVRIITGTITESNPEGFELTTPLATIGIRGTILYVEADDRHTTVKVFNSDKTVVVNGIAVPETFKITLLRDGETEIVPLAPGEEEEDTNAIVLPSGGEVSGLPPVWQEAQGAAPGEGDIAVNPAADIMERPFGAEVAVSQPEPIPAPVPTEPIPAPIPAGPELAHVEFSANAGTTYHNIPLTEMNSTLSFVVSVEISDGFSYGFDVNLNSGAITSGVASGKFHILSIEGDDYVTGLYGLFDLTGGEGMFDSGTAEIRFDPSNSGGHITTQQEAVEEHDMLDLDATLLEVSAPSGYSDVGDAVHGALILQQNGNTDYRFRVEFDTVGFDGPLPDGSVTSVN
ncbi:MAG: FecR family protein [Synergistaceae bacterium]|nr:FecR family protein [Synergistaceae bacterium]